MKNYKTGTTDDAEQPAGNETGFLIGMLILGLGSGMGISALVSPHITKESLGIRPQTVEQQVSEDIGLSEEELDVQNTSLENGSETPEYVRPDGSTIDVE